MSDTRSRLLDTPAACAYLSIAQTTLRGFVATGDLPVVRVGRMLRFDLADLDALVDRLKKAS